MDIYECTAEEFVQGFDFGSHKSEIDLESDVETIEKKAQAGQEAFRKGKERHLRKKQRWRRAILS